MRTFLGALVVAGLWSATLQAHEFWISPEAYSVDPDTTIKGELIQGENFAGRSMPYHPRRFHRFDLRHADELVPVKGRDGDDPALKAEPLGDGLHVVIHQSKLALVTYDTFGDFQDFLESKRLDWGIDAHRARNLPDDDVREAYFRYAKALVGVGSAEGQDQAEGLPFELVALTNPYTEPETLRVRLLFKDKPYPDADLHVFHRSDGAVTESWYRTDANGEAKIPLSPGAYLLNAVHLQEASERMIAIFGAVWQTLWASMTFEVSR